MRAQKTNLAFSGSNLKSISNSKIDITALIKKSKIEEKKEKLIKFYLLAGLGIAIFILTLLIVL